MTERAHRLLSVAVLVGLLVAVPAAFAITESLKLTLSPITRTRVVAPDQALLAHPSMLAAFSPTCSCRTARVALQFWLRNPDNVTIAVENGSWSEVRLIVADAPARRGWNTFTWNGRTDWGSLAPDGTYEFQVGLASARRTILLPNPFRLDTQAPRIVEARPSRVVFSPDGDRQADRLTIAYHLSESGHVLLLVDGQKIVQTRSSAPKGSLAWYGKVDGRPLPQGTYQLRIGAVDLAGNVTSAKYGAVATVRVRYIELKQHRIHGIKAGTRFGAVVDTDAAYYQWRLGSLSGVGTSSPLVIRAPRKPGTYRLFVSENGHRDSALVTVVRP
ncbi:MAG: FlgD immunoglobulin-like domain containing protein [Gaiellaceae bacterium]